MKDLPPSRRLFNKVVAAALTPLLVLGALPAAAQVEVVPHTAVLGDVGAAAHPAPAAMIGSGLPVLTAPSALVAAPIGALSAAPATPAFAAAAQAAPASAAPAAAATPAPSAAPAAPAAAESAPVDSGARAAADVSRSRAPDSAATAARVFSRFLDRFIPTHASSEFGGAKAFDGAAGHAAAPHAAVQALGAENPLDIVPQPSSRIPSTGLSLQKKSRPAAAGRAATPAPAQGIALDADPTSPASVEKALRALVDSDPKTYGAPSQQLATVSVNILPSIQPGQGASILAVFRQAVAGADNDDASYLLAVAGKSITFHIKVFDGKPVIMSQSGQLAAGVSPDVMKVAFSDNQLLAIAAKRSQLPPDNAQDPNAQSQNGKSKSASKAKTASKSKPSRKAFLDGLAQLLAQAKSAPAAAPKAKPKKKTSKRRKSSPRQGKAAPRGDQVSDESSDEPAAPGAKFLTRQLTDQLDGKWRAINIYQASDPKGEPLIVIVDVKSGEAFALSAKDLHTGDEATYAENGLRRHLISGTVSGRATLPAADGSDNGPIGPIALPLTNVYQKLADGSEKVVAVTDEHGNFSIPDDGTKTPIKLTIRLAGPLVPFVKDENAAKNGPIEVTVTATPGEKMSIMLNPVGDNPELAANIVGYVGYLNHHLWVKNLPGMDAKRMDVPLAGGIVVNGHEEQGNAFYDPSNDSVNLMAAATITVHDSRGRPMKLQVENTAVWSIEDHEDTHRVVQTYSQIQLTPEQAASPVYRFVKWSMDTIMGSDVNESIADVVSDFMRGVPIIGAGFYGNPPKGQPNYIRTAEDKTPYDPKNPDPHNGVLVQSMWATRAGFIASLGQAAGAAYANAMVPLILIAQPLNPIDALFHMVLWDMREDGSSPFGDLIRRIAKDDHGIDVPPTPLAPVPVS